MELTCSRCHQTVQEGTSYCPACGLPQLVYAADGSDASSQGQHWGETVRDAGSIDWKPAMRSAIAMAVPAGMLCAVLTHMGLVGLLLMPLASAWVVALYMRSQRPAWITVGAGARLGLVTGIIGGWTAILTGGFTLYAMRFWLHQGNAFDDLWTNQINQGTQQLTSMGIDAQTIAQTKALMLSPEGRAGSMLFNTALLAFAILVFAVAGGALGARLLGRPRRTEH